MGSLVLFYLAFLVTTTSQLLGDATSECNGTCDTLDDCSGQLICISRKCNDDPDVGTSICKGGEEPLLTPPPLEILSDCNGPCNNLGDCSGQLICINRKCKDDPDVIGTNICKGGGSASPLPSQGDKKQSHVRVALLITIPLLVSISLSYLFWRIWRKKHSKKEAAEGTYENLLYLKLEISNKQNTDSSNLTTGSTLGEEKIFNLPQFSFSSISAATNNFSPANKLGEGGFGPVYKVKRLWPVSTIRDLP